MDNSVSNPALVLIKKDGTRIEYSWKDYEILATRVAIKLLKLGVKKENFVTIIAVNLPESFFVIQGIILAGAIPVPINAPLVKEPGQKELKSILKDCKPSLVIASQCLEKHLTEVPHIALETLLNEEDCQYLDQNTRIPEQVMIMPYTSGTTGGSKGVMLSLINIESGVKTLIHELKINNGDKMLSYLSLGHISELIATFFGQLWGGYTVYFTEYAEDMIDNRERFRGAFPTILCAVKPTIFLAVPKVWANIRKEIENKTRYIPVKLNKCGFVRNFLVGLIKRRVGLDEARIFISAGSKLNPDDKSFFARLDIRINDIYGQTEIAGPLTIDGKVVGKVTVTKGEKEEILVRGQNVMLGYYNNQEATARALESGIYHTGDVGIWPETNPDQEGRVFYGGRLSDSFKLAQGEFVSAEKIQELEEKIKKIKDVNDVIVCGDSKPYLIAIIFGPPKTDTPRIEQELSQAGTGLWKVKKFIIADTSTLEFTPTLKIKRKVMIKKFENEINAL